MSINLKDSSVIKCLSYNAYSSIAGFGDKFADSVATGVAKIARKYGMDSDKNGGRNDKRIENVLSYSEEKADMREVYAGWSGFKICESPSRPEYRFIFFQEPVGNHSVNLRLICVEKGNDRNFVIGIIFNGVNPDELRLNKLVDLINEHHYSEIIIAFKQCIEGEMTALYIKNILSDMNIKVSRIASGIPIGADMEYVDSLTLEKAFDNRQIIS